MSLPPASPASDDSRRYRLEVNYYDQVSSLLIALLAMVGVAVFALVVIWFARVFIRTDPPALVIPVNPASRPADAAMGLKRDIEPPGIEEAPELSEPELMDTLQALTSAASSKSALLSDENIDSHNNVGRGSGLGDSRSAGVGGEGDPVDEPQRELRFDPKSLDEYARWLDAFQVELGVLGRDNRVHYASHFLKATPDVRQGDPLAERRLYFNSAGGALAALDRKLAEKAGIASQGRYILQFFPNESAGRLLGLEQQRAGKRTLDQIKRTIFRVERQGASFGFTVEEQTYY